MTLMSRGRAAHLLTCLGWSADRGDLRRTKVTPVPRIITKVQQLISNSIVLRFILIESSLQLFETGKGLFRRGSTCMVSSCSRCSKLKILFWKTSQIDSITTITCWWINDDEQLPVFWPWGHYLFSIKFNWIKCHHCTPSSLAPMSELWTWWS